MAKILLVDNDTVVLRTLRHPLETAGHFVLLAANGRRAWEILEDNPGIDAVITDLSMPEMTGQDLVRKMRSDTRFRNVPVLMMSSVCSVNAVAELLTTGSSLFLPKPVATSDLLAYVASATRRRLQAA